MKRFRRRLWNGLAAISLLLCVSAAVLSKAAMTGPFTSKFLIVAVGEAGLFFEIGRGGKPWKIDLGLAFMLTAILPLIWLALRYASWKRSRAQARMGRCPVCGYDLRATPDRCPECGAIATKT